MDIFEELHKKFLVIPLVIVGCLLAVTFCTIFGITFSSTFRDVTKTVDAAIDGIKNLSPDQQLPNNKVMYIFEKDEEVKYYHFDYLSEEESQVIVDKIINSNEKVSISVNNRHFMIRKRSFNNGMIQVYAAYDYTEQFDTIQTLGLTLATVYTISLIIIAGLSYLLATNATKPVKEAFEKEKELVANASHELKTPLTVASTNLELVQSDPNSTVEENKKWLDGASYQIKRMNNLILQMLELSKLESSTNGYEKHEINISNMCEGLMLSFEANCFEKSIELETNITPNIKYSCNNIETEKLMTTLVDNAMKYTPKNGKVTVSLTKSNKHISYKVENTGEGIPPEKIAKIFDRFYKADESHQENGNSFGLGLSIAKSIAESLNGTIKCTSELGKSTTFEVTLPIK